MIFLFEDKKGQALSELIVQALQDYGKVEFSSGNMRLISKIEELSMNRDDLVVFTDVPFDNFETIQSYNNICKYLKDKQLKRALLFPVICAEYVFLSVFARFPIYRTQPLNISLLIEKHMREMTEGSIEVECKYILKNYLCPCAMTVKGPIRKFYQEDCPCKYPWEACIPASLKDKSLQYMCGFPVLRLLAQDRQLQEFGLKPKSVSWKQDVTRILTTEALLQEQEQSVNGINALIAQYYKAWGYKSVPRLECLPFNDAADGRTDVFANM